jgi:L-threonylcarbamoyladenylate synthase
VIRLAAPNSVEDFARLLYAALREADAQGLKSVVVAEPVGDGLALAIRDRLMRASKGR